MDVFLDLLKDSFLNAVLVTGLVVIMMMMIECFNVESHGRLLSRLRNGRVGQVVLSAFLGVIPGCMGGFASVSLYTHGLFSFGALIAMMIASSGDEAFVMLAMIPGKSLWIFIALFVIAVIVGLLVDLLYKKKPVIRCEENYNIHEADSHKHGKLGRHFSPERLLMFVNTLLFILLLVFGVLEHDHGAEPEMTGGINLLSEDWMNIMFAVLSVAVLAVLAFGSDHFVKEHLWNHVVRRHLPSIFFWTFGVLVFVNVGLHYLDISSWISANTALMIVLATLVGIIPESGPHMIFVTLYASGVVPLPVLLASCISQDGHASLPLIAESKESFLKAKIINCAAALVVGFGAMLLF
mgnify:CR=1 FL=1